MNRFITLALAFISAVVFATRQIEAACSMHPDAPPELSKNHDCCRIAQEKWEAALARIAPSDESLFQTESLWENEDAESDTLAQLAGRPQIVAMAYTSCEYACPRLLADLKAIETRLSSLSPDELGIVIVTLDPERDTPERFRAYAKTHGLDPKRWTLLRGNSADTLELANLLGVQYQKLPNGEFTHSNVLTLLNAKGEIVQQVSGLGADASPLLDILQKRPEANQDPG